MADRRPRAITLDADRIVQLRHGFGWTGEELAARAAISPRTLQNAESGRRVSIHTLAAIAHALAVRPEELLRATSVANDKMVPNCHDKHPKVFICHSKKDASTAEELFQHLSAAGAEPWLDKKNLVLGDDWEREVIKAVAAADAFVVCLRPGFDDIGFRQKEVRLAIEALKLRPPGRGFIIPFVLEPCTLPDWCKRFHAGSDLSKPTTHEELIQAIEKHCGWSAVRQRP